MRGLLALLLVSGCVQSEEVHCADGRLCPPGYTCDDAHMRCLSADQVAACAGRDEGADCTIAGAPGGCRSGACEPLVCGDGVKSLNEACDGEDLGGATCKDAGFYDDAGLACTSFCTFDTNACTGFCGDAMVNGQELCDGAAPPQACSDFGFDAGSVSCGSSCGISFATCARFGWVPEATGLSHAYSLDASSESDVWIGGTTSAGPAVAHYAGNAWTFAQLTGAGTPIAIAAVGGQDAWIVQTTSPRSLQHYTGGGWTAVTDVPAADYRDIWAASATGVFVATSDLGVLEWTGSTWQTVGALGVGAERIDGTDASDVWVVTAAGDLQRWDGAAWTPVAIDMVVSNIDVVGTSNVWAIGASASTPNNAAIGHWDGTQWTITLEPALDPTFGQNFKAVTATAANDAWVAEPSAHSRHFDGFNWSPAGLVATSGASGGIMAMKSFPGTAMQITFDGYFYRYRGQMYARFATDAAATLRSSASTSPTVTVAIDINNVHMFDGTTWSQPTLDARNKFVLWAAGPGDIWVGGTSGLLYRFDGTGWNDTAWGGTLTIRAIAGSSSTDVWLFGTTVYHYDGVTYTQSLTLVPAAQITNASSSGPNDVWAISGGTGTDIHHWDGGTWTTTHIDDALVDIVALAPDNAFAVGGSRIFHWDGSTWTSSMFPVTSNFVDIAATGPSDVFAVTSTDMFHFDGARWASVRPPVDLEIDMRSIMHVDPHRGYIDLVYNQTIGYVPMRRLIRTRLWNCSASETNCSDGVDDDCDNVVDNLDSDCP